MKITQLAPNQAVVYTENEIVFNSYETIVCRISNGVVKITQGQPQSKTTTKYLNLFLQQNTSFNNYKEVK